MKKTILLLLLLINFNIFSTLKIAYTDFYPYSYTKDSKANGLLYDISNTIFTSIGYDATYSEYKYTQALSKFNNKEIDVIIGVANPKDLGYYYSKYPLTYLVLNKYNLNNNSDIIAIHNRYLNIEKSFLTPSYKTIFYYDSIEDLTYLVHTISIGTIYEDNAYIHDIINKFQDPITNTNSIKRVIPFYIVFNDKDIANKFEKTFKHFRNTVIHDNIQNKYRNIKVYKRDLSNRNFYIPMLFVTILSISLLIFSYSMIKYNHFNLQSIIFVLSGAILTSLADLVNFVDGYNFAIKLSGTIIVGFGVYKTLQKLHNKKSTFWIFAIMFVIGFYLSYILFSISVAYFTLAIITIYCLVKNIKVYGLSSYLVLNIALLFYITFSVLVGLGRLDIILNSNSHSLLFLTGFLLQLFNIIQKNKKGIL